MVLRNILKKYGFSIIPKPLWKLRLDDDDRNQLRNELISAFYKGDRNTIDSLAGEFVIYIASWWGNIYEGPTNNKPGKPNILDLLSKDLDTTNDSRFQSLYKKGITDKIHIPIFQTKESKWYLYSILLQGGLPINYLSKDQSGNSKYKAFLKELYEFASIASSDWNDISFIKELDSAKNLPTAFRDEVMYELGIQIVRAFIENDYSLLPYDESKLHDALIDKETTEKIEQTRFPFTIHWFFQKDDNILQLYYEVDTNDIPELYAKAKHIDIEDANFIFDLMVQNRIVARYSYFPDIKGYRTARNVKSTGKIRWEKGSAITICLLDEDGQRIVLINDAPNNFIPDFNDPILCKRIDNEFWEVRKQMKSGLIHAVLFNDNWKCNSNSFTTTVQIGIELFKWSEFEDSITLSNGIDTIDYNTQTSDFSLELLGERDLGDYKGSEFVGINFYTSEPIIKIFDEVNNRYYNKKRKIYFREYKSKDWKIYERGVLPKGLIELKVEIVENDGVTNKYLKEKFYYLGFIQCKPDYNKKSISIIWENGTVTPVKDQKLSFIEQIQVNTWKISTIDNELVEYCSFQLMEKTSKSIIQLNFPCPFNEVVVIDKLGRRVQSNQLLCINALSQYILQVMTPLPARCDISQPGSPFILNQKVDTGTYPLSIFESLINKFSICIGGLHPLDDSAQIRLSLPNFTLDVRKFNADTSWDEEKKAYFLHIRNQEEKISFKSKLFAIPMDCISKDLNVKELREDDSYYYLVEEMGARIVFSDTSTAIVSRPRFFEGDYPSLLSKGETLIHENAFSDNWMMTLRYCKIAREYSLPFRIFKCFDEISKDPTLMAKFYCMLITDPILNEDTNILDALADFENEYNVCWHWINSKIWNDAFDWYAFNEKDSQKEMIIRSLDAFHWQLLTQSVFGIDSDENRDLLYNKINGSKAYTLFPNSVMNRLIEMNDVIKPLQADVWLFDWERIIPSGFNEPQKTFLKCTCLSALSLMDYDLSKNGGVWSIHASNVRKTINYYRRNLDEEYSRLVLYFITQIINNI